MASIIERHITAYLVYSMVTTYRVPERMPYGLHFKNEGRAVEKIGNFIVNSIDKYGIVTVRKRLYEIGYSVKTKEIGNFYRWWRQNIMGFDTKYGTGIESFEIDSTINIEG
jgi:hypothetical protein